MSDDPQPDVPVPVPAPPPPPPPPPPAADNAPAGGEPLEAASEARGAEVIHLVRQTVSAAREIDRQIIAACNLAQLPALAEDFVARGMTLEAVTRDLQRRQAEAQDANQIEVIDTAPPNRLEKATAEPSEISKVTADRFARQMGRT